MFAQCTCPLAFEELEAKLHLFHADWRPLMSVTDETYFSYLLRLWRAESNHGSVWRASLESAQTGELHHFSMLGELIAFLRERTEESTDLNTKTE